jgi:ubiquinone/menaquinone biosynthesis C-methylase UbiE
MSNNSKKGSDIYQQIADFWSFQLNNEIYLRNHPKISRGTKEYFKIILDSRKKFIYYFPSMISHLKKAPNKNLLEVGCGMGTDSFVLNKNGFDVIGIDLSSGHLKLAKKLFRLFAKKGSFMKGNAGILPFPDNSFGCAYSYGVLHHTPNTEKSIKEIFRVLSPSGRAVIMLYHKWSLNNLVHCLLKEGFENVKNNIDTPITYRFSKNEVRNMCSDFKSCNIKTEYLYGPGWGRIYNVTPKPLYLALSKIMGWHLVVYLQK